MKTPEEEKVTLAEKRQRELAAKRKAEMEAKRKAIEEAEAAAWRKTVEEFNQAQRERYKEDAP